MLETDSFNAADWLVDRHVREGRGDRIAFESPDHTITYAQVAEVAGQFAAAMREFGVRRNDRICFVANDDIPLVTGILGAMRGGFVAAPMSTMLHGLELTKIIGDCQAQVVLASTAFTESVLTAVGNCPNVRHLVWDGDLPQDERLEGGTAEHHRFEDILALGAAAPEEERAVVETSPDEWSIWLYTSGTTGTPKGAMHRHANVYHVATTYGTQVLQIQPDDVCYSIAKVFFAYGIGNSILIPLSVGARSVLEPARPTPAGVAARIQKSKPTLFFGVPTFFALLLNSDAPNDLFSGVRYSASAGEALPSALQGQVKYRFGLDILDGIGSTELLHIFLSNAPGDIQPGTTGRPVPGYEIQLRDLDGHHVPVGNPGNLYVRGESMALGYWNRVDASRQVFQGEWLNTGDIYVMDEHGYYTCMGRNNDLIKAGGIWMSPVEVESRLLEHEAVRECAVIGVRDENDLDKPVAFVVVAGENPPNEKDLQDWCREKLAAFKAPRQVLFVDSLPKTATGKLQRFKLRAVMKEHATEGAT